MQIQYEWLIYIGKMCYGKGTLIDEQICYPRTYVFLFQIGIKLTLSRSNRLLSSASIFGAAILLKIKKNVVCQTSWIRMRCWVTSKHLIRCLHMALWLCLTSEGLTLNSQSTSKVPYAKNLDQDKTPSNSASHPDSCCLILRQHFNHSWATLKHLENWSRREI